MLDSESGSGLRDRRAGRIQHRQAQALQRSCRKEHNKIAARCARQRGRDQKNQAGAEIVRASLRSRSGLGDEFPLRLSHRQFPACTALSLSLSCSLLRPQLTPKNTNHLLSPSLTIPFQAQRFPAASAQEQRQVALLLAVLLYGCTLQSCIPGAPRIPLERK